MAAKMENRQRLLCRRCADEYGGRYIKIDNHVHGQHGNVRWVLLDKNNEIMLFEVNGHKMLGYSMHLEQISIIADKLMADRFLAIKFHIGRTRIPDDIGYAPLGVRLGKCNIRVTGSVALG